MHTTPIAKATVTINEIVDASARAGIDLRALASAAIARADAGEAGVVQKARAVAADAAQRRFKVCAGCPHEAPCRASGQCATEGRGKLPSASLLEKARAVAAAHSRRPR